MASEGRETGELWVMVNQVGDWPIPETLLERGVRKVLEAQGVGSGEVSVTFMGDDGMEALNRDFLGRQGPTDVIAFALQGPGEPLMGDIYVGYEQARRQAGEHSVPLDEELLRLAVHGTLHVLGHDHPEGEERISSEMFVLQEELLGYILGR